MSETHRLDWVSVLNMTIADRAYDWHWRRHGMVGALLDVTWTLMVMREELAMGDNPTAAETVGNARPIAWQAGTFLYKP